MDSLGANLYPVKRESDEWYAIQVFFQLSMNTSTVNIQNLWSIRNSKTEADFHSKSQNQVVFDCAIDLTSLSAENTIQDICHRGLWIGTEGLVVSVGDINAQARSAKEDWPSLPPQNKTSKVILPKELQLTSRKTLVEMVICKVAPGLSYPYNLPSDAAPEELLFTQTKTASFPSPITPQDPHLKQAIQSLPPEYDSIFLSESSLKGSSLSKHSDASDKKPKQSSQVFTNTFLLKYSNQICPLYFAQLIIETGTPDKFQIPTCDECKKEVAVVWCESDNAGFCLKCDEEFHSRNNILKSHHRIAIFERSQNVSPCTYHRERLVEFYCILCKVGLCELCVRGGWHCGGEYENHSVVPLESAYRACLMTTNTLIHGSVGQGEEDGGSIREDVVDYISQLYPMALGLSSASSIGRGHKSLAKRKEEVSERVQEFDKMWERLDRNIHKVVVDTESVFEKTYEELAQAERVIEREIQNKKLEVHRMDNVFQQSLEFYEQVTGKLPEHERLKYWLRQNRFLSNQLNLLSFYDPPKDLNMDVDLEGRVEIKAQGSDRMTGKGAVTGAD